MDGNETRGERIARLRAEQGMTVWDLCLKSQVREANIRNWEAGRTNARDAEMLASIAEALSVTVDYLLDVPCGTVDEKASRSC